MTVGRARLRFSSRYETAIRQSDVSFLVVPTPSDPGGGFSTAFVVNEQVPSFRCEF